MELQFYKTYILVILCLIEKPEDVYWKRCEAVCVFQTTEKQSFARNKGGGVSILVVEYSYNLLYRKY